MRSFIGGLLGLCLGLALLPQDASARTDSRTSAQSSQSSRSAAASRPATPRPGVTRTTTASRSTTASRPTAGRATTTTQRQALAPRGTASSRSAARSGNTRQAAVPYARQPAASNARGLRQTAMASCTTRNGRRTCTPGATRTSGMSWTGGLAPAAFSQTGCPDGTIATMAIGHSDITRCVPL